MKGLPELVIGDLKVKRPVIQGGMGVGVSLGQLAGAVAKEGGVGIISTAQIGFREPDFETNTRAANIRAIGSEFQRARETAPDGVIGFNIMVALVSFLLLVLRQSRQQLRRRWSFSDQLERLNNIIAI